MRGRCMRFEAVLHVYRNLRWDGVLSEYFCLGLDDIFAPNELLLSAPQPAHRPPTTTTRLTFTNVSYKSFTHPFQLAAIALPHYSHPPLNDTVKSLNSIFISEQYVFPIHSNSLLISVIHPSKFQKILLCCCVEIYKIQVYHWRVRAFSAKSTEYPPLNILLWNHNLFN